MRVRISDWLAAFFEVGLSVPTQDLRLPVNAEVVFSGRFLAGVRHAF